MTPIAKINSEDDVVPGARLTAPEVSGPDDGSPRTAAPLPAEARAPDGTPCGAGPRWRSGPPHPDDDRAKTGAPAWFDGGSGAAAPEAAGPPGASREPGPPRTTLRLAPNPGLAATNDYGNALARLVLAAVLEATPHLGRPPSARFVCALLGGGVAGELARDRAWELAVFGTLAACSRDRIASLVRRLVERGLIEEIATRPRGLVLTAVGRALLDRAPREPSAGCIPGAVPVELLAEAQASGLLDALHGFRRERARVEGVAEYRVLDEATIRELACARPKDVPALRAVSGIGPAKAARYGGDLVALIRQHEMS